MIFRPPQRALGHYRVASDAVVPTINGDAAGFAMNTSELRAPPRIVARAGRRTRRTEARSRRMQRSFEAKRTWTQTADLNMRSFGIGR